MMSAEENNDVVVDEEVKSSDAEIVTEPDETVDTPVDEEVKDDEEPVDQEEEDKPMSQEEAFKQLVLAVHYLASMAGSDVFNQAIDSFPVLREYR